MATGIPARLTREEGRKFGLTVGIAFLALSGLLWWRGRPSAALMFAAIGAALALAGLLIPARLGRSTARMGVARRQPRVTTLVFMGIVYFLILTPMTG